MPRPRRRVLDLHPPFATHPSTQGARVDAARAESPPPSPVSNPLNDASPFQEQLNTNYVPSCEEIFELRKLAEPQQAIEADLDGRIRRLKEQVSCLEEEKRPIEHFIRSHNILKHPFRHLPLDILREIFLHCSVANTFGIMDASAAPMVLTMVCQLWRQVALSTPALWTRIQILLGPSSIESDEAFVHRLGRIRTWLSRSGSLPLTISVVEVDPGLATNYSETPCPPTRVSDTFDLVYPHVSRWERLHIHVGTAVARPYVNIPPTELQALRSVDFGGIRRRTDDAQVVGIASQPPPDSPLFSPRFFAATGSKEITIRSTFARSDGGVPGFVPFPVTPWANITSLSLGSNAPVLDLRQFLLSFSPTNALESLSAEFGKRLFYSRRANTVPTPPSNFTIDFPHLQRLSICEQAHGFSWFGEAIRCPILQQLEYHPFPEQVPYPPAKTRDVRVHNSFVSVTVHSGVLIQSLTFDPKPYSPIEILHCLVSCPNVRELTLVKSSNARPPSIRRCGLYRPPPEPPLASFDISILRALVSVSPVENLQGEILCPRLSTLICDPYEVSFTLQDLVEFLRIKQSGVVEGVERLRMVLVRFGSTMAEEGQELYDEAMSLVDGGADNAKLLFREVAHPKASVRDGIWHVEESKPLYRRLYPDYF